MDRKSWHERIREALRSTPKKASSLADQYLRAATRSRDAQAVALARFFQGEAYQVRGLLRSPTANPKRRSSRWAKHAWLAWFA